MSELRKKLKEKAAYHLEAAEKELLGDVAKQAKIVGVSGTDLCKLICLKRTDTLRASLVNQIANVLEAQMLKKWNDQQELENL